MATEPEFLKEIRGVLADLRGPRKVAGIWPSTRSFQWFKHFDEDQLEVIVAHIDALTAERDRLIVRSQVLQTDRASSEAVNQRLSKGLEAVVKLGDERTCALDAYGGACGGAEACGELARAALGEVRDGECRGLAGHAKHYVASGAIHDCPSRFCESCPRRGVRDGE